MAVLKTSYMSDGLVDWPQHWVLRELLGFWRSAGPLIPHLLENPTRRNAAEHDNSKGLCLVHAVFRFVRCCQQLIDP
jgi:hypothetical protein